MADVATIYRAQFTAPRIWGDWSELTAKSGELLTMPDGAQWFHPYDGGAPVRITDQNRSGLDRAAALASATQAQADDDDSDGSEYGTPGSYGA